MERKNKKIGKAAIIALFFLAGGIWYLCLAEGVWKEQKEKPLVGVFESGEEKKPEEQVLLPENPAELADDSRELVVYVCGAVNEPGIYTLPAGSRLYEVLALAGGFSAEADSAYHNLARTIVDGERIYILSCAETKELTTIQKVEGEETARQMEDSLINLNTATVEQLMSLPGIGEAKAANIVEYRKQIGNFTAVEEIMNVSGIGEAMFEKIKDKIAVK